MARRYDPLAGGGGENHRAKRLGNRLCMHARLDSSAPQDQKRVTPTRQETARFLHICHGRMRPRWQISRNPTIARGFLQQIERQFQIRRARAAGVESRKGGRYRIAYVLRRVGGNTTASNARRSLALVLHFMQTAPAMRAIPDVEGT